MFDVLHQLVDKVHGWRSEEDRVNAHTAIEDYRAEREHDPVPPTDGPAESDAQMSTEADTAGKSSESTSLFTPSGDKSSK